MGTKKFYILLLLMILLLGSILYSVYDSLTDRTIKEFNKQQMLLAKQAATSIEKYFRYYFLDLSYLSEISSISSLDPQGEELIRAYYEKHSDGIRAITRVSTDGHILYTVPYNQLAIGADISYQDHIQAILATQKPVISDVFQAVQGYQAIAYHVPVFHDGTFNGTLSVLIPFDHLAKEFLTNIKLGKNGYAWLISQRGVELYCPVPGHVGKTVFDTSGKFPSVISMVREMLEGKQGITTYTFGKIGTQNIEEIKKHAVFCPIQLGNTFWSLVIATPEKEVLATMTGFRNKFLFIIVLLLTAASVFSYYILRASTLLKEEKKRRHTEKALRESEKRYKTILDEIEDGYFEVDIEGNLTFFNDSLCKILGYPRDELMGKNNREFMDPENAREVFQTFNKVFTTEQAFKGFDWEVIQKNGTKRQLDTSVSLIKDADGRKSGFRGIARDISERKQVEERMQESENRYQALFDRSLDCVFIHDFDGNFIDANEAALNMLGYTRNDLASLKIRHIISKDQYPAAGRVLKELQATGQQKGITVFRMTHKNGQHVDVETKSSVIYKKGKPYAIQGIARNITGKVKMENQLRQAQKMEAIGTLAGGIAHDFNNILSAILGYSEMAMMELPEKSPGYYNINQVFKAGMRAKDLVKQILTFSRKAEQDLKPLNLLPVVKEALKLLRASIPTTIEIRQHLNPDCGRILADPVQIHQIIMNLCTNAYHAMRESGGTLDISLSQAPLRPDTLSKKPDLSPGFYIKMEINDTGCGMDALTMDRIFDPYFTTKPKGEGTGMGLAMVHGIVKSYNGDIIVYSETGKGSSFQIYLPVVDDDTPPDRTESDEPLPTGSETIMIVDDEAVILRITQKILGDLGYRVIAYSSSPEALNAFEARPETYDMIITDMTMPKMNGIQLTRRILSTRPEFPVILCTGFSDLINKETIRPLGIKKLIMKPVLRKTLARAVREVLDDDRK